MAMEGKTRYQNWQSKFELANGKKYTKTFTNIPSATLIDTDATVAKSTAYAGIVAGTLKGGALVNVLPFAEAE